MCKGGFTTGPEVPKFGRALKKQVAQVVVSGEWSDHVFGRTPARVSTIPGPPAKAWLSTLSNVWELSTFTFLLTSASYVLCTTRNKVLLKLEEFMVDAKTFAVHLSATATI